jgi:hypothetical protein
MIKCAFIGNQRDIKTDERIDYRVFLHPERLTDRATQEAQVSGHSGDVHHPKRLTVTLTSNVAVRSVRRRAALRCGASSRRAAG